MGNERGRRIEEVIGVPTAAFFAPGGSAGLTDPWLAIERDSRTLYAKNAAGQVVSFPSLTGPQTFNGLITILAQGNQSIADLTVGGSLAVGGGYYNHVTLAVGYGPSLLTDPHQVGVWSVQKANTAARGAGSFNAGFETGIGTDPGAGQLEAAVNYAIGAITVGAGSTILRTWGVKMIDDTAGTHNAFIAYDSAAFTGNWFIYYDRTRPSYLGGALQVVGKLNFSGESGAAADDTYIRLWGGNVAGADLMLTGTNFTAASRGLVIITAATVGAPTGDDGTVQIQTAGGTAKMDRAAGWKLPAAFACNGATPQTAAASGGALAAYAGGANGLDTGGHMQSLHALVVAMRAALVANGIMS